MKLAVRDMSVDETSLVIDYFHTATPEYLEMLGVDPTRLPPRAAWSARLRELFETPIAERWGYYLTWLVDDRAIGFSSCDRIVFGERANMHLHVSAADQRSRGIGARCVRLSIEIYFRELQLKRLFCEPNALNIGPNRTLQSAGFRYVKTHMTVPGALNYHQPVTQWVIER